ncbi:MAG: nuclear transport factor 2 family protein [Hyphomonadaceae bacterium]|nr:nuclear transport factor 2 family protein [Hyphomonadaceae bacterium]
MVKRWKLLFAALFGAWAMASTGALAQTPGAGAYAHPTRAQAVRADDALAIVDVIARMNGAIDTNDYPLYASHYTTDGVIDSGFGPPVSGHAAIIASLEASAPFITNKRHAAANIVLSRQGRDIVATYYLTVFERASSVSVAGTALIVDEFRNVDGVWRVVRHTTRMDPATIAAMMASQPAAN